MLEKSNPLWIKRMRGNKDSFIKAVDNTHSMSDLDILIQDVAELTGYSYHYLGGRIYEIEKTTDLKDAMKEGFNLAFASAL